jgi:DNA-binding beta-propeller fold protein YncE
LRVTTINTATGMPTGATITVTGALASGVGNPLGVLLSPDGARALIATTSGTGGTSTSQVAVIDAATGTQIGKTVTINGALSGLR